MLRIKIWLAAVGAVITGLLLAFWRGKNEAKDEGYAKTRKRMDKTEVGTDPDAARRWLHERGER